MCRWMQQQQIIARIDNEKPLNNALQKSMSGKSHTGLSIVYGSCFVYHSRTTFPHAVDQYVD